MTPKINMARWQPHLAEAKRRGQSVAAYAAQHQLSPSTLYAAAKALREDAGSGKARRRRKAVAAFAAVRMAAELPPLPEPARLRAQLPNGVVLHFEGTGSSAQMAAWLSALGALACSA